jgi:hypothetical protein
VRTRFVLIVGILLAVAGTVWMLQGLNVIQYGFMSGDRTWVVIGAVVLVAGLGLSWWAWSRRAGPKSPV